MSTSANTKLTEARQQGIHLIVADIDGTLVDPQDSSYGLDRALELVLEISNKGVTPALISARDASLKRKAFPLISEELAKAKNNRSIYLGFANGSNLWKITNDKRHQLYSYAFTSSEVAAVLATYDAEYVTLGLSEEELHPQGLSTFRTFLSTIDDWTQFINPKLLDRTRRYRGRLFVEESKISIVLPRDRHLQLKFKQSLQNQLGSGYFIRGDDVFTHISKQIVIQGQTVDSKRYALEQIIADSGTQSKHIVAFGDQPDDNDQELLKAVPFAFTNNQDYKPKNLTKPPFLLPASGSPVIPVYTAINYLLS